MHLINIFNYSCLSSPREELFLISSKPNDDKLNDYKIYKLFIYIVLHKSCSHLISFIEWYI